MTTNQNKPLPQPNEKYTNPAEWVTCSKHSSTHRRRVTCADVQPSRSDCPICHGPLQVITSNSETRTFTCSFCTFTVSVVGSGAPEVLRTMGEELTNKCLDGSVLEDTCPPCIFIKSQGGRSMHGIRKLHSVAYSDNRAAAKLASLIYADEVAERPILEDRYGSLCSLSGQAYISTRKVMEAAPDDAEAHRAYKIVQVARGDVTHRRFSAAVAEHMTVADIHRQQAGLVHIDDPAVTDPDEPVTVAELHSRAAIAHDDARKVAQVLAAGDAQSMVLSDEQLAELTRLGQLAVRASNTADAADSDSRANEAADLADRALREAAMGRRSVAVRLHNDAGAMHSMLAMLDRSKAAPESDGDVDAAWAALRGVVGDNLVPVWAFTVLLADSALGGGLERFIEDNCYEGFFYFQKAAEALDNAKQVATASEGAAIAALHSKIGEARRQAERLLLSEQGIEGQLSASERKDITRILARCDDRMRELYKPTVLALARWLGSQSAPAQASTEPGAYNRRLQIATDMLAQARDLATDEMVDLDMDVVQRDKARNRMIEYQIAEAGHLAVVDALALLNEQA